MRHALATTAPDAASAGAPSPFEDDTAFVARVVRRLGRRAMDRASTGILPADDMARLWRELLAGSLSPAREAAILMGLRIHGESAAMLAACAEATRPWCAQVPADGLADRATVVLHCIGAARRQPALAPLLAMRLAQLGVRTLVVTSASSLPACAATVFDALGVPAAANAQDASELLATQRLARLPVQALSPALARLLGRRSELGFRSTAHAAIKLLAPVERAVVVANYTHPAYRAAFATALRLLRRSALLVRGTDGDPVAWSSAAHEASAWLDGNEFALPPDAGSREADDPAQTMPASTDVAGTARFIRECLATDRLPAPIETQVQQLAALARAARSRPGHGEPA